jgi:hypothetical protein
MTQIHNEFFIEKDQLPVDVRMTTGEELSGLLFVQPSWRRPSVEYDAPILLNVGEPFFPLQLADGSTRLVAKAHVVMLRGHHPEPVDGEEAPGEPASVAIRCSNGEEVRGHITITRYAPNMRVLDFLNHVTADEFIPVHERDSTALINRRHIMLVTDESDGAT